MLLCRFFIAVNVPKVELAEAAPVAVLEPAPVLAADRLELLHALAVALAAHKVALKLAAVGGQLDALALEEAVAVFAHLWCENE